MLFLHSVYSSYGGIANEASEREKIAESLGNGKAAILMNHGLLTVGETVDEATLLFCLMERSCKIQLLVDRAEPERHIISDEEAAYTFQMASTPVSDSPYQSINQMIGLIWKQDTLFVEFQSHYQYEEHLSNGSFKQ